MSTGRNSPFGELLKRHRAAAGLTQEELAERARLSVRGISDLERGINHSPRRETIAALADAFNLSGQQRTAFELAAHSRHGASTSPRPVWNLHSRRHTPLVGRAGELTQIERFLLGETPPLLVLAGEPGIGKSRLLTEAAERAVGLQFEVLAAGCQGRGGQFPYAPLLTALDRYITRLPSAQRRTRLRSCEWMARLLPELAETSGVAVPAWTLPPEQERRLIFAAVARFLTSTADSAGVVLVLDDLQWAHPDALDLMVSLLRADTEIPIRIIAAYRDTEVHPGDPLSIMLAELARDGMAYRLPLGPLNQDAAAQLLHLLLAGAADNSGAPDSRSDGPAPHPVDLSLNRLEARILERAGGIPLFLVSCAHAIADGDENRQESIPWDVAEMLRLRIARLPASARDLLAVAAMIGRDIPFGLLSAIAQPDETLAAGLEAACTERLLLEAGDDYYQFAHDLIREVVAADLGSARRSLLHRRIAQALEQSEGERQIERLAYHYVRSGEAERAAHYLELAGDRAETLHAFADAESYYREALARLDRLGQVLRAAAVREKLGVVLMTCTRFDEAFTIFDAAAAAYERTDDVDGLGRVVTQIGWGEVRQGTPRRGLERIQRFLERSRNHPLAPRTQAGILMVQAFLCFVNGRYQEQLAIDDQLLELARGIDDAPLFTQAQAHRSLALNLLGRFEEARLSIQEVLPALEAGGDPTSLMTGLNALSVAYQARGELDLAERYLAKQIDLGEKVGDPVGLAFILSMHAGLLYDMGRWEEMGATIARADVLIHGLNPCWATPYVRIERGTLALAQGRTDEGTRDLEAAGALTEQSGDLQVRCMAQYVLASDDLLNARPRQAQARIEPLMPALDAIGMFTSHLQYLLAWAALDVGRLDEAEQRIERCLTSASARQDRLLQVDALLVRARLDVRQDRWLEAVESFHQALRLAQSMRYPYGEARAHYVSAQLLTEHGEKHQAHEHLTRALDILRALGERVYAPRIEAALKADHAQASDSPGIR